MWIILFPAVLHRLKDLLEVFTAIVTEQNFLRKVQLSVQITRLSAMNVPGKKLRTKKSRSFTGHGKLSMMVLPVLWNRVFYVWDLQPGPGADIVALKEMPHAAVAMDLPRGQLIPGAKMMSAIASIIDEKEPEEINRVIEDIVDPAGFFYRFSLPVLINKKKITMKRITIDPITRLEGHGKIEIFLNDEGEVR